MTTWQIAIICYAIPGVLTWRYVCNGTVGSSIAGFLFGLIWPVILRAAVWVADKGIRPR